MIAVIAGRELRALFNSPLAWAILAIVQFLLASQFFKLLADFIESRSTATMSVSGANGLTEAVASPLLGYAGVILLFSSPMLTSRIIAEERRYGTLNLLYAAPVSIFEIVLGKYLGVLVFFAIMALLTTLMPISLAMGTTLDYGTLGASFLGLMLLIAAFAALGLFVSSLTRHPTLAGVITFGILLWLWLAEWTTRTTGSWNDILAYLSIGHHFVALLKGVFSTQDLAYYLLFIALFLALTIWRLDVERAPG